MTKNFILLIAAIGCSTLAFSQYSFANTRWKQQTLVPHIKEMVFKNDTLTVWLSSPDEMQILAYAQHNDSLMIKKISGRGKCPESAAGWYRIEWVNNGDNVLFQLLNDECEGRARGMIIYPFEKIRN